MRHLKLLSSLAIAAAAIMALAASASATTVTTATDGPAVTPSVHFVSEGEAFGTDHIEFYNGFAIFECNSTLEWQVESHGSDVSAKGKNSTVIFSNCTDGWTVEVQSKGSLEVQWSNGYNGTVISNGMILTSVIHIPFWGTGYCRYATENTHIGTVTGGNPATIHLEGTVPQYNPTGLCTAPLQITGSYVTTGSLYVNE